MLKHIKNEGRGNKFLGNYVLIFNKTKIHDKKKRNDKSRHIK